MIEQPDFYLFITCGDKPFRTKEFSAALGVARLSFAPAEKMHTVLGTKMGAVTVFSALLDSARGVRIVIDKEILEERWYPISGQAVPCKVSILSAHVADLLVDVTITITVNVFTFVIS